MLTIIIAFVVIVALLAFWWWAQGFVTGLDYSVLWIVIIIFTELILEERDRVREQMRKNAKKEA